MDSKIFLGRYRVSPEEIGAVGEPSDSPLAYKGEEIDSGKKVVVELFPTASLKATALEKLEAQALAAKTLDHVNICALHDFGAGGDNLIYVTEDFEGTSAEEWVNTHGPMPVGPVLRIAVQVTSALAAAACHQVVHQGINPSNLMLVPGQTADGEWPLVKVLHFAGGAPRLSGRNGTATAFVRSFHYASPEQLQHGVVDFRSQMYSLGATMWFLLSGTPPPTATEIQLAADKLNTLPKEVRRLLAQMLSVNPEARPGDPLTFYKRLQDCLIQLERPEARPRQGAVPIAQAAPTRTPKKQRTPLKAIMRALLLLALSALTALVLREYIRYRQIFEQAEPLGEPIVVSDAVVSATPTLTVAFADTPAPTESVAPQHPAEPAVRVTLLNFTPMIGRAGDADFRIATLTFKIEASASVAVTEASFYVDSVAFDAGSVHNPPITLLIHTGIFLGPPGTMVDPENPIVRTVWLKSQENLFPNWLLAYNQTENATFRWTLSGQPVGGSVVKPLHNAWAPEVRRAEPAEPDLKPVAPDPSAEGR
jgi:serine/threonine-protein kinase